MKKKHRKISKFTIRHSWTVIGAYYNIRCESVNKKKNTQQIICISYMIGNRKKRKYPTAVSSQEHDRAI